MTPPLRTPLPKKKPPPRGRKAGPTPAQWTVYIVRCSDGSFYTGYTGDMEKRLAAHNSGKGAKYTASRRPVELVYREIIEDRFEAMKREYRIKCLTRVKKQALVDTQTTADGESSGKLKKPKRTRSVERPGSI